MLFDNLAENMSVNKQKVTETKGSWLSRNCSEL